MIKMMIRSLYEQFIKVFLPGLYPETNKTKQPMNHENLNFTEHTSVTIINLITQQAMVGAQLYFITGL